MAGQTAPESAREKMVESQVRPNQVHDRRVIAAMLTLPREAFAPPGTFAYSDADISLGQGRYLLAPLLTAKLAQLALEKNPEHALVVGAGAGYLAAILAACGVQVVALEEEARLNTGALRQYAPGVTPASGKLTAGWPSGGPYEVIVIEGAVPAIPPIFLAQLAPGGRVVTILSESDGAAGLGRGVVAEATSSGFACVTRFDCTARMLPCFRPEPVFSF